MKQVAAHYLRDAAHTAPYFRFEPLQAPKATGPSPANGYPPCLHTTSPRFRHRKRGLFHSSEGRVNQEQGGWVAYQSRGGRCRARAITSALELTCSLRYTCRMCERTVSRLRCRRSAMSL